MPTVAAILGSAHDGPRLGPVELEPRSVSTPHGTVELHRFPRLGAQVNSMTLGPEVVLANELEIPTAGLVVGHKHSRPDHPTLASDTIAATLQRSRDLLEQLVLAWLRHGQPVPFGNQLYRFG